MANILIVDEVRLSCRLMAAVLDDEPDLKVVATATSVEEALNYIDACDLVLVSARLPEDGATGMVVRALEADPDLIILVIGLAKEPHRILQLIEAGASGYVLREDSIEALLENIHAAREGRALISADIAALLMARVSRLAGLAEAGGFDLSKPLGLTAREREVLDLIGEELTNQEIADRLFIEVGTVKNHVHNILNKLNVGSREEAAAYLLALERRSR